MASRIQINPTGLVLAVCLVGLGIGCERRSPETPGPAVVSNDSAATHRQSVPLAFVPEKVAADPLPNVIRIHPAILSGGLPEGPEAFRKLTELGIQTIISVDGAKPDIASATAEGIRYVHLPIGYNGISEVQAAELARAVRDLPAPIYIHCHHGKHRSPTAAAVAAISAGLLAPECSVTVLTIGGTSREYAGLYLTAEQARRIDNTLIDAAKGEFPPIAELPEMVCAMVEMDHCFSRLERLSSNQWETPAAHPDLDPAHESLMLRELFTELIRNSNTSQRPNGFASLLNDSLESCVRLEAALKPASESLEKNYRSTADAELKIIRTNCTQCHTRFRNRLAPNQ